MAEPISLASGLLTLATFAFQSSITLYNTIQSFQNHPERVRSLAAELEALQGVLRTLNDTLSTTTDIDVSALTLPLLRCGKACGEFEEELRKCSSRSSSSRTSFRDWAKLKYMGDGIDDFRQLLAGYKSTISIALTDANLRKSSVTAESLQGYKRLIKTATDDLEAHLGSIDEKLETIFARTATESETAELRHMQEDRLSTQQCLQICAQLSDHISQIQLRPTQRSRGSSAESAGVPERIAGEAMQDCKTRLNQATERLEGYMHDVIDRMMTQSKASMAEGEFANLERLREEWSTARQCMDICFNADYNLKKNISIIDNQAIGDETVQFLVSTSEKTIHGKNRGDGFRIRQVGGHLSDESLQQMSRDIAVISSVRSEVLSQEGDTPPGTEDAVGDADRSDFQQRHGRGMKLASKSDLGAGLRTV
ncbi:hypothetical protein BCR34DRAFT_498768 [Clohesyomyces aquaticus]|uniref:Azaphilone pigments biosynthesis cluster protein L N-terminal domain-containing protein n=1 Tax=Clohesyomyces aquaticus TaxID=1231657 RepID=A0A1Y1YAV8_9PLEO|nr:hypothetical protein BCR34DRAFT_498768 [Clohesyomyces aquaticus]